MTMPIFASWFREDQRLPRGGQKNTSMNPSRAGGFSGADVMEMVAASRARAHEHDKQPPWFRKFFKS